MEFQTGQAILNESWKQIESQYTIISKIGEGTFGTVVKAQNNQTNEIVAIKLIKDFTKSSYHCRQVVRELIILRKFTEQQNNMFITKIVDIILPTNVKIPPK
jgi:serine/threonine protein kinase